MPRGGGLYDDDGPSIRARAKVGFPVPNQGGLAPKMNAPSRKPPPGRGGRRVGFPSRLGGRSVVRAPGGDTPSISKRPDRQSRSGGVAGPLDLKKILSGKSSGRGATVPGNNRESRALSQAQKINIERLYGGGLGSVKPNKEAVEDARIAGVLPSEGPHRRRSSRRSR